MNDDTADRHLTDAELFGLALPATGEPEAIPEHLAGCQQCSRALQDWKASVAALAEEDVEEINRRTPADWRAAEDATMAAIRRAGRPGRRSHPVRWALGIAAAVAVLVLAMPPRRATPDVAAAPAPSGESELSPADRADDELLREASFLAAGGDDADATPGDSL
jgi:hypothetical protein